MAFNPKKSKMVLLQPESRSVTAIGGTPEERVETLRGWFS